MKNKKRMIYVTKEQLQQSSESLVTEPNLTDIAQSERATRQAMQVDFPASNLITFIELVQ